MEGGIYLAGHPLGFTTSNFHTPVNDLIYAYPFIMVRTGVLSVLGVRVSNITGVAGDIVRLAVYSNLSNTIMFPDALLYDSGDIAAVGPDSDKICAPGLDLEADHLYWVCVMAHYTSPTGMIIRCAPGTQAWPILGDISGNGGIGYTTPFTGPDYPDPMTSMSINNEQGVTGLKLLYLTLESLGP